MGDGFLPALSLEGSSYHSVAQVTEEGSGGALSGFLWEIHHVIWSAEWLTFIVIFFNIYLHSSLCRTNS